MSFLKSIFAGIVILAVAMVAKPLLLRALQLNAAPGATGPSTGQARRPAPAIPLASAPLASATYDPRRAPTPRAGEPEDLLDAVIDVRRIEGRINAASTRRLAELLQRHPDLAAQAMRRWLAQGSDSR